MLYYCAYTPVHAIYSMGNVGIGWITKGRERVGGEGGGAVR